MGLALAATPASAFTLLGLTFDDKACATESGQCNYTGNRRVAYGAQGKYTIRTFAGPVACTSSNFGDPAPGLAKSCHLEIPSPTANKPCPNTNATWTTGGNICTGPLASTPAGSRATATDTVAPTTGSAIYACISGTWQLAAGVNCTVATAPPPPPTPTPTGDTVRSDAEAARFLVQATFGPTMADLARLRTLGYNAWFNEQFAEPRLDTHWGYVARRGPLGCTLCESMYINATMESFWKQAVQGRDQLRQRMVFALSELFVVSTVNSPVDFQPEAHASYLDMLARNAFGNFRTLLEDVTLHPTMGHYLSYLRNEKEDPATGRTPDENYAREVMQLFSIGLWQLNDDGTRRKNATGQDIPTYGMADVMGMARVMTGLSWGGPDTSHNRWAGWIQPFRWDLPMQFYNQYHSTGEKRFLGTTIPASATPNGAGDLRIALDTLFNHPNVGPFLATHLIKRFVTSNPSPAYVQRVAQAFNGGAGRVRGDMAATLRAVLMDPEARNAQKLTDPTWGKLREPIVRYGNYLRAFNVTSASGAYQIWNLEDPVASLGQNPLRAPSVFNWFRADYAPPGEITGAGLTAPEFQITHETTLTGYNNFLDWMVERSTPGFSNGSPHFMQANYAAELALAGQPDALLDRLNLLLMAGQMSASTRSQVRAAMLAAANNDYRVYHAIRLLMASPEFIVQK
ncbi:MAG: DUF1800 domain-containing protein [Burkholderiales bacterium]|nr:DUF1800 domain-containing protein [Burkholderiales bacterium]